MPNFELDGARELRWLHGLSRGAWGSEPVAPAAQRQAERFSVLRLFGDGRSAQSMHPLSHIEAVAKGLAGEPDTYVSQASFIGATRRKSMFARVRACWVDLDLYTKNLRLDERTIRDIEQHCDTLGLPHPTLIVSSGRGAYCKWILTDSVTSLPAWDSAQAVLVVLFERFGADKRARDACRVFRLIGSRNSKVAGDGDAGVVRVVGGCGQEVPFVALAQALENARKSIVLPATAASDDAQKPRRGPRSKTLDRFGERLRLASERGSAEELSLYAKLREPILQSGKKTPASLGWARFCDLRDLFLARGGIPVGQRDLALFWMVNSLSHAGVVTSANWKEEVEALLRAFPCVGQGFNPLEDGSLSTWLARLKKTENLRRAIERGLDIHSMVDTDELLYRPSNKFLIETFSITEKEQQSLSTIISSEERQRRRDEKVPGRAERREQRQKLRERIVAWLEQHNWVCENISALARLMGETVGKVWRIVRSLLDERKKASENEKTADAKNSATTQSEQKSRACSRGSLRGRSVPAKQFMLCRRSKPKPRRAYRMVRQSPPPVQARSALMLRFVQKHGRIPTAQEIHAMLAERGVDDADWLSAQMMPTVPNLTPEQAQQMIDRAREQAQQIIDRARQQARQKFDLGLERLRARAQAMSSDECGPAKTIQQPVVRQVRPRVDVPPNAMQRLRDFVRKLSSSRKSRKGGNGLGRNGSKDAKGAGAGRSFVEQAGGAVEQGARQRAKSGVGSLRVQHNRRANAPVGA